MDVGLLVLRLVVGGLFAAHGAQKLFGWFGGHGLAGTGGFFESLGLRPGRQMAIGAGLAEFAGGLLLMLGLLTPLAAMLLIGVMVTAIVTVHAGKGPWATDGGWEYNLVLLVIAFALTAAGAGAYSLDAALGLDAASTGWALLALAVGVAGAISMVALGRSEQRQRTGAPTRAT